MNDRIEVEMSYVRNMGNYESMRVSTRYGSDVTDGEDAEALYARVHAFVEKKMLEDFDVTEEELAAARKAEKKKEKAGKG